jgi:hypothetical protein
MLPNFRFRLERCIEANGGTFAGIAGMSKISQ